MGEVISFEEVQKQVVDKYVGLVVTSMVDDLEKLSNFSKNKEAVKYIEGKLPKTKGFSAEIKLAIFMNALALAEVIN